MLMGERGRRLDTHLTELFSKHDGHANGINNHIGVLCSFLNVCFRQEHILELNIWTFVTEIATAIYCAFHITNCVVCSVIGQSIDQYDKLLTKVSKSIAVLYKTMHVLDCQTLHILYQSLVEPHMSYCCEIWQRTYQSRLKKLFLLQKKAIRIIYNLNYDDHIYMYYSTAQTYLNFMVYLHNKL